MDDSACLNGSIIEVELPDGRIVKKRKKLKRIMRPKNALCQAAMSKLKLAKMNNSLNSSLVKLSLRTNNRQLARALEITRSDLAASQQQNLRLQEENQALLLRVNELERLTGTLDQDIDTEVQLRMKVPLQKVRETLNRVSDHLLGTVEKVEDVHRLIASLSSYGSRPGSLSARSSVSSNNTSPATCRPFRRPGSLSAPKRAPANLPSLPGNVAAMAQQELEATITDALCGNIEDELPPSLPADLSIIVEQTFCEEPAASANDKPAGRSSRSRSNRRSARLLDTETLHEIRMEIEAEAQNDVKVTDREELLKPEEPSSPEACKARSPATRRSKEDDIAVKRRTRSRSRSLSLKRSSRSKPRDADRSEKDGKTDVDQDRQASSNKSNATDNTTEGRSETLKSHGTQAQDVLANVLPKPRRETFVLSKAPAEPIKPITAIDDRRQTYCIPVLDKTAKDECESYVIPSISADDSVYESEDMDFTEVISSQISLMPLPDMPLPDFIPLEQACEPSFLRGVPTGSGTPSSDAGTTPSSDAGTTPSSDAGSTPSSDAGTMSNQEPASVTLPAVTQAPKAKPSKLQIPKISVTSGTFKRPLGKAAPKSSNSKKEVPQVKSGLAGSESGGESANRAKFNAWQSKPGKITFTRGRKSPEDIMKEASKSKPRSKSKSTLPKVQSRSKSRSKPRLLPDMSPKTVFDFMGTPKVSNEKEGKEKSMFEMSLNESIKLPTSTYSEFRNRHKKEGTDTENGSEDVNEISKKKTESEDKLVKDDDDVAVDEASPQAEETREEETGDHGILLVLGNGKRTKPRSKCKQVSYATSLVETHITTPQKEDSPNAMDTPSSVRKIKHAGLTPPRPIPSALLLVPESPGQSSQDEDCVANVRLVGAGEKAPKHSKLTIREMEHLFSSDSEVEDLVPPSVNKKHRLSHKSKKQNKPKGMSETLGNEADAEHSNSDLENILSEEHKDVIKSVTSIAISPIKDSHSALNKNPSSKISSHKGTSLDNRNEKEMNDPEKAKTTQVQADQQDNQQTKLSDQLKNDSETSKAKQPKSLRDTVDNEKEAGAHKLETSHKEVPIVIAESPDVKSLRKRKSKAVEEHDHVEDDQEAFLTATSPVQVQSKKIRQSKKMSLTDRVQSGAVEESSSMTTKPPRPSKSRSKRRPAPVVIVLDAPEEPKEDNSSAVTADPAAEEPVPVHLPEAQKKGEMPSNETGSARVEEHDSRVSEAYSHRSSDADENAGGRRQRRAASSKVSYKEPSLGSKLRRGDAISTTIYKSEDIQIYKATEQPAKKKLKRGSQSTGRRSVLSSLNIANDASP